MTKDIHHEWPRYWLPVTETLTLEADGFLPDPEDLFGRHYNPMLRQLDSLRDLPILVLLGEPGCGKSTALEDEYRQLLAAGERVHRVRLEECTASDVVSTVFEAQEVEDWRRGDGRLFLLLDSLDECRLTLPMPNVVGILMRELGRLPTERLCLRLSCRTSEWPWGAEDELDRILARGAESPEPVPWETASQGDASEAKAESARVWELVFLRRKDVEQAARDYHVDSSDFLTQVHGWDIEGFAALPNTLRMLLSIYSKDGSLPDAKAEIFRRGCALLAEEISDRRVQAGLRGELSPGQRLAVAGRIAAMLLLASRRSLWLGNELEISDVDLSLREVYGDNERADGMTFAVDSKLLNEVRNTSLFSARGSRRLGFGHQSWAEYLAAAYLAERVKDADRLLSLLRWAEDRRIPPRLSELAAWLASLSLPVFDALAITEPALLLRSDLAALDGARKEKLVGGVLAAVQDEEPTVWRWESRRSFAKLEYAGLAEQLRPWIANRALPLEVRATALQIALACKVAQLADLATDLALAVDEPPRIRHASARLVANHGSPGQLARLRSLAVGPAATEDLQSILLTRLWPDHVSTEDLFQASCVAHSWQCLGGYRYAPDELLDRFNAIDVVIALNWLQETVPSHVDLDSNRLAYAIAARAWELLDDPSVMHAFSHVVWRCLKRYVGIFKRSHERTDAPHPFTTDNEKRRRLLLAILPMADQPESELVELVLTKDRLLFDEDLPWLLDQYEHADDDRQKSRLTHCMRDLFSPGVAGHWSDRLVDVACRDAPNAFSPLADFVASSMEPIYFGSEAERRARDLYQRRLSLESSSPEGLDPSPAARVAADLADFVDGDSGVWMRLWPDLGLADDAVEYPHLWCQISKAPGWLRSSPEDRQRIVDCAAAWATKIPMSEIDLGVPGASVSTPDVGLWLALALLAHQRPSVLQEATAERWAIWIPALVFFPSDHDEDSRGMLLQIAWRKCPDVALADIDRKLAHEIEAGRSYLSGLDDLQAIWSADCAVLVRRHLRSLTDPAQRRAFLTVLLDQHEPDAVSLALDEFTGAVGCLDDALWHHSLEMALLLMKRVPSAAWPILWARTRSDPVYGVALWTHLVHSLSWDDACWAVFQEADLSEFYGWLEEHFPAAGDRVHRSGQAYRPTRRDDLADLREACIHRLVAFGTVQAIEAIERLAERFPGQPGWRERLHAARAARREKEWRPLCPRTLITFLQQTDKRFVRDAAELSEAVIASLKRFQDLLQGDTPLAPFLWNVAKDGGSGRPKSEDRFSDFVLHHLRRDLPGAVIDREVQVLNARESGIGERTDLKVEARTADGSSIMLIIESKGCWNPDLFTAMRTQLKDRYLQRHASRQGFYLVGYFGCDFWSGEDRRKQASRKNGASLEALQVSLARQATELSDAGCQVTALVLDIRHPRSNG
ncbi:MAG: hypothetical protein AW10_01452 [Candidatus Accumulibacter appositus]|uniref:Uncharacterized protein n=1 Tax=Candidatus Accumulibacter appositus TaxID=1454003 RepID=A0A011QPN0_9PROT|nr:MAG: hypothetical protein AW10_01452 [Candidatus Accumulibacter appositus]